MRTAPTTLTADYHLALGPLLLGPGTPYELRKIKGLREQPGVRSADAPRAAGHGAHPGRDWADVRVVEVELDVAATDQVTFAAAVEALLAVAAPGAEHRLWSRLPGTGPRCCDVRVRRAVVDVDLGYEFGLAPAALQAVAVDPLLYGPDATTATLLPAPGGGLVWPLTSPLDFGAPPRPGRVTVANPGTAEAGALLRVRGPLPGFEVVVVDTGQLHRHPAPLAAGPELSIDTATGAVLLDGTADRRSELVVADWWTVPPRGTRTLQFAALGPVPPEQADVPRLEAVVAPAWW